MKSPTVSKDNSGNCPPPYHLEKALGFWFIFVWLGGLGVAALAACALPQGLSPGRGNVTDQRFCGCSVLLLQGVILATAFCLINPNSAPAFGPFVELGGLGVAALAACELP